MRMPLFNKHTNLLHRRAAFGSNEITTGILCSSIGRAVSVSITRLEVRVLSK